MKWSYTMSSPNMRGASRVESQNRANAMSTPQSRSRPTRPGEVIAERTRSAGTSAR